MPDVRESVARPAAEVMQEIVFAAVADALAALKAASKGVPNTLLRDLNSTNGTLVNGQRVGQAELVDGTTITIGTTTLVFRSG